MRSALVYGTFDPVTSGHLWLVFAGLEAFDRIVVAVAPVAGREAMFAVEERVEMWRASLHGWGEGRVEVVAAGDESEARLACKHGCGFILAGLRNAAEYAERAVWQQTLHEADPAVLPVYLVPDARVADISATGVRELVGRDGWAESVRRYLQPATYEALYWKSRRPGDTAC